MTMTPPRLEERPGESSRTDPPPAGQTENPRAESFPDPLETARRLVALELDLAETRRRLAEQNLTLTEAQLALAEQRIEELEAENGRLRREIEALRGAGDARPW